jgi:hypothetical protein
MLFLWVPLSDSPLSSKIIYFHGGFAKAYMTGELCISDSLAIPFIGTFQMSIRQSRSDKVLRHAEL